MSSANSIDFDKYRLRSFVDRLIEMGEVDVIDKPVPLTGLSPIIEGSEKAILFRKAGPEQVELVAKTAGNRKRLAAAFETSEDKLFDEYFKRLANPQPLVEVPSADAPVHDIKIAGKDVDLTKLSQFGDRLRNRSGHRPAQCRLPPLEPAQPLRNRHQRHRAVGPQAYLHRVYRARREAAGDLHGRFASARFFRRHDATARRRTCACRQLSRRAGAGGEKPDQ
jgi:hypothetical protein